MNVTNLSQHFRARSVSVLSGLALLVVATTASADDIFIKVGGQAATMNTTQTAATLAGDSTDPQYPGWIRALSVSHGVGRSVTLSGGTVSSSAATHSEVLLSKTTDKTSPSINVLVNGVTATVSQPVDYVTIDFRRSGVPSAQVYYRIELQGVYFTAASVSSGGYTPNESISLFYTKIKWSYVPYDDTGKAQAVITKGWDVATNKAL